MARAISYDQNLAVDEDLAFVPTTQRATAATGSPAVFDFAWPTNAFTRVKGFEVYAWGAAPTDEITAEVGFVHPEAGWVKVQDLTFGALPMPQSGKLVVGADYGMKLVPQLTVRIAYATTLAAVPVAIVAQSWFPAGEIIAG